MFREWRNNQCGIYLLAVLQKSQLIYKVLHNIFNDMTFVNSGKKKWILM